MLLLAASTLLGFTAYGQKEIRAGWVARVDLGDGRMRHFEMDGSNLHGEPEKGKPLDGLYHIYTGEKGRYTVAEFKDGLYDGSYERHFNTIEYEKGTYVAGRREGEFQTYDDAGKVRVSRPYRNGSLDGTVRYFYRDGSIANEDGFRNGIEHGPQRDFRQGETEPYQYENYFDGRRHGEQLRLISCDEGEYYERCTYDHGEPTGEFVQTWVDGGHIKERVLYGANGKEGEWFETWPDGSRRAEKTYVGGRAEGKATNYYPDGKVSRVCHYKNGRIEGALTYFNQSTGKKISEYNYIDGLQEGSYRIWSEDGKLREEGVHKDGEPVVRKEFYKNGRVKNVRVYDEYEVWRITESYEPNGKERYSE